jgi:EAL domain-containing protein (putative c-di-GMP-specific phosphodiesterase class I)
MMRVFAQLAGTQIDDQLTTQRTHREAQLRIQTAISGYEVFPVYQPILELVSRRIVGLECLSRFRGEPRRSPDVWFQEAADVGLAIPLELHASKLGLAAFNAVPEDVYLSVNASPSLIEGGHISALGDHWPWSRVLVEITEHAVVNGYERMRTALEPLRERGAKIAVDDAGAGYASFRHILDIRPDVIKLDISLTRNIDTDRHRRALAAAMVRFSQETDIDVIAEGVETDAELAVLRDLGVTKAQGYLLGRPQPLNELVFPPAGV